MSTEKFKAEAQDVEDTDVCDQMEQSYIDYAMSIIGGRALPDVRDGLKPVQRRLLYKMNEMGVTSGSSHRKSSSVVGETMGDLHPHGDSSIYDALVRMAQDFSLRHPLVDGQGNFGSMDGDPPAAMRYTEARMSKIGESLLDDIDKDTVNFSGNYDNRLEEPDVLPAGYPNILVNGASGIAVGMATDIPPHNLGEVIDATIHRIQNPDCTLDDLIEFIPGPDLPTGGEIIGKEDIYEAYQTGDGSVTVRASYTVEPDANRIIITEIPYKQEKSKLLEKIANEISNGNIEGVNDVRDESDRNGVRIVIELKSNADINIAENQLVNTSLEKSISMNHIVIADGQPRRLSLVKILDKYIEHRTEVVRRRSEYELNEAEQRKHILTGRKKALENIDDVVDVIQDAEDRKNAVESLKENFDLSTDQAEHITRMQLSSLTNMQKEELENELVDLTEEIERLTEILENQDELNQKIISELRSIKETHNTERKSDITNDYQSVTKKDLIEQEEVIVVQSEEGYLKRIPRDEFPIRSRNSKGMYALKFDDDKIKNIYQFNTHDELRAITSNGRIYPIHTYNIPESSRQAHGSYAHSLIDLESDEEIEQLFEIPEDTEEARYITVLYESGRVDKSELKEFQNIYQTGQYAFKTEDERIVDVTITDGDDSILIATEHGKCARYVESDIRPTGVRSKGMTGITLNESDRATSITSVNAENTADILVMTEEGKGKRVNPSEFRSVSRPAKGVKLVRDITKSGKINSIRNLETDSNPIFASTERLARISAEEISQQSRQANGVSVMVVEDTHLTDVFIV